MNALHLADLIGALTNGALSRRGLARGLAGAAVTAGLIHSDLDDLEAKKRKKRKKGKKRNRRGRDDGGNQGGGSGGGGDQCSGAICDGQCVDLNTDSNNCG